MTAPRPTDPDDIRPELLAAYADEELDDAAREAVERWLADHPEAIDSVLTQRELSPANRAVWDAADPPPPTDAAWAGVRRAVERAVFAEPAVGELTTGRNWRRTGTWLAGGLAAAIAAAVAWFMLWPANPAAQPVPPAAPGGPRPNEIAAVPEPANPLAGIAVLPIATDNDVDIQRVTGTGRGWLTAGSPPLPGRMVLAGPDDVTLEELDPNQPWPAGGPDLTPSPGATPMIFAPKPR